MNLLKGINSKESAINSLFEAGQFQCMRPDFHLASLEETGTHFGREIFRADEVIGNFEALEVRKVSILAMEYTR